MYRNAYQGVKQWPIFFSKITYYLFAYTAPTFINLVWYYFTKILNRKFGFLLFKLNSTYLYKLSCNKNFTLKPF